MQDSMVFVEMRIMQGSLGGWFRGGDPYPIGVGMMALFPPSVNKSKRRCCRGAEVEVEGVQMR